MKLADNLRAVAETPVQVKMLSISVMLVAIVAVTALLIAVRRNAN